MTHQIDPDARYIAAGIARAECYANTFDRLRADLEADLVTAAAILEEAAATRRRSRRLAAWVIASAALGSASVYAIVLGAITAAGLA